jgi:hypothetical protein
MKPNTGSVNFGRVSLQFKKSHKHPFQKTHLCLSEKPKCCRRWHPTQAPQTPQILSKDQRRAAAPMTKFQCPNKPKKTLPTRKKDLEERGRGTNQGLETGRRKEGRA